MNDNNCLKLYYTINANTILYHVKYIILNNCNKMKTYRVKIFATQIYLKS